MKMLSLYTFVLFSTVLFSQNKNRVNSLKQQLTLELSIEEKSRLYSELGQAYFGIDNDSILFFAEKNLELDEKYGYPRARSIAYSQKGIVYSNTGRIDEGVKLLYRSLWIRERLRDSVLISAGHINIGNVHFRIGLNSEDHEDYERADQSYKKAHYEYKKACEIAILCRDSLQVSKSLQNLSSSQFCLFNYTSAIDNYRRSYEWVPQAKKDIMFGEIQMNIVSCLIELGEDHKAISTYNLAIPLIKKHALYEKWISANLTLSAVLEKSDLIAAKNLLLEGDSIAIILGNKPLEARVNLRLYDICKLKGEFEHALFFYEKFSRLSRDVSNQESEKTIKTLELKYNNQKAKQKALITEQKLQQELVYRQITSYGVILILAVLVILFILRQRLNRLEKKQDKERHEQEVSDLIKNSELESIEATLDGQELERKRIAADLHDRLGSTLSAIRMYFEAAVSSEQEDKSRRFEQAYNLLDTAVEDTRNIAHDLISGTLSKFGLFAALFDLKQTIEGAGSVRVELEFSGKEDRFDSSLEINLYRIIQETFSNSLKHGKPSFLRTTIDQDQDHLTLTIEDDGVGFDVNAIFKGIGIQNIRSRVHAINGELELVSELNTGTFYKITILLVENEEVNYS